MSERLPGTWCGFLQCVPAVKGPLLLLAQVGAMLQQPMRDPALADTWKAARHLITTERFAPRPGTICRQPLEGFKRHKRGMLESIFSSDHLSLPWAVTTEILPGTVTHRYGLLDILLNYKLDFGLVRSRFTEADTCIFVLILWFYIYFYLKTVK